MLRRLSSSLARLLEHLLLWLLTALAGLAVFDIVGWLGWQRSWSALAEIQSLLLVWFALLAAAWAVHDRRHLAVGLLVDRAPAGWRPVLLRTADLAVAAFGLALSVYGWGLVRVVSNSLPATGWPARLQYLPAVFAGALIVLFALDQAVTPAARARAEASPPP